MFRLDDHLVISPTDLVARMHCDVFARLALAEHAGLLTPPKPEPNATLELAQKYGEAHERRILGSLIAEHGRASVVEFGRPKWTRAALETAAAETRAALEAGAQVVYQGTFFDGDLAGHADFLIRTGTDPATGSPIHEPFDTKLSRHVKPSALLQLAAYADQMVRIGRPRPERVWVWLGSGEKVSQPLLPLLPVLKRVRSSLLAELAQEPCVPSPPFGDAKPFCGLCRFEAHCEAGREAARDTSLVAGIRRDQRKKLREAGLETIEALAKAKDSARPRDLRREAFDKLRAQARLQVKQDATRTESNPDGVVSYEVYADEGLARLPAPSPGDVFFDMEGDAFAEGGDGLEYLFGVVTVDLGNDEFRAFWAHSRAEEKVAFESLIDFLVGRRKRFPGAHVYHYAAYEASALARLAQRHATREREVDDLLREGALVNLYPVVTRSLRISQRSYSIKKLEPLYLDTAREGDVTTAGDSIAQYEAAMDARALGDKAKERELLEAIALYNERDCVSTRALRDWLLERKRERGMESVTDAIEGPARELDERESSPLVDLEGEELELTARLLEGVPTDPAARTPEQWSRAHLSAAVSFHRRERRQLWWRYFERIGQTLDALEADPEVVRIESAVLGTWGRSGRQKRERRSLELRHDPDEALRFGVGADVILLYEELHPDRGGRWVTNAEVKHVEPGLIGVEELAPDEDSRPSMPPVALFEHTVISTKNLESAIRDQVARVLDAPKDSKRIGAVFDLLERRPPYLAQGRALPHTGDARTDIEAALRAADRSYVAVQGPPGTGKTYVGTQVVAALVRSGWHIGVVAQSHATVEHFLVGLAEVGVPRAQLAKVGKKGEGDFNQQDVWKWRAQQPRGCVVGGTAWTFVQSGLLGASELDLLVVEEAGQFSLANLVAASVHAKNLLLLGDPRQLPQVTQGVHPEPIDESALGWLMRGAAVMPPEHGYFLETTHRMHTDVCRVVSNLAYDGRLHSDPRTSQRSLAGIDPGVHAMPVPHSSCGTHSPEEVQAIVELTRRLLGAAWNDGKRTRPLEETDVLLIAPYNRQVAALRKAFELNGMPGVSVGTVDKFQGKQAPVVILSMTASSADELPRGLDFLFSTNRLNVAISRAQWAAYVVHSPRLADVAPPTPEVLALLGGFLGVVGAHGFRDASPEVAPPRDASR